MNLFRKTTLFAIYALPAVAVILAVGNKVFPLERYRYDVRDGEVQSLLVTPANTSIVTPLTRSNRISIAVKPGGKTEQAAHQNILVRKGYAASFYPVNSALTPPEFKIKKHKDLFYLVSGSKKKLVPTMNILQSYQASSAVEPMSEEEFERLELDHDLAGFMDGTLISRKDTIYVITNGRKAVISAPEVFDALGYDWSRVVPATDAETRIHSSTPAPLTLTSPHPDGTILSLPQPQGYAIVNHGELIALPNNTYETYYKKIAPVGVSVNTSSPDRVCALSDSAKCSINLDEAFLNQQGGSFFFQLPDSDIMTVEKMQITFERNFSFDNLRRTLRRFTR